MGAPRRPRGRQTASTCARAEYFVGTSAGSDRRRAPRRPGPLAAPAPTRADNGSTPRRPRPPAEPARRLGAAGSNRRANDRGELAARGPQPHSRQLAPRPWAAPGGRRRSREGRRLLRRLPRPRADAWTGLRGHVAASRRPLRRTVWRGHPRSNRTSGRRVVFGSPRAPPRGPRLAGPRVAASLQACRGYFAPVEIGGPRVTSMGGVWSGTNMDGGNPPAPRGRSSCA